MNKFAYFALLRHIIPDIALITTTGYAFEKWSIKLYVDYTNKRNEKSFTIKGFNNINHAKEWLSAPPQSKTPVNDTPFI